MSTETKHSGMPLKVLVNFCRILLGLTFMFSGIVKAVDPTGTPIKLIDYLYAFGMGESVLASTLLILACILAGFEILIGSYLVAGAFNRGASLLALLMMVFFTPFTLYLAIKNPVSDCGCFGDAVVLSNWQTFAKNVFLLALALLVFIKRKLVVPFMSERRHWMVTVVIVAISVRFMASNIINLPVLDFRPYKVGTDLRTAYENHDMTFTDFCIMNDDMDDVNCNNQGYNIIGLTASGTETIRQWTENAGADLRFLFCDEIPLQTIVRSNPGLVLLKNGVIVNKWSHANIPSDEELSGPLETISVGQMPDADPLKTPWAVALLFALPLLLLIAIDRLKELIQ